MADLHDLSGSCIVIGAGLAGLSAALALAPHPVLLLSKAPLGFEASSVLAQGGVAASLGPDDDVALHLNDTLEAGDGLCDESIVREILSRAPAAIAELVRLGVPFDRDSGGNLLLGLEAAHSRRRIVHAGGDASGREILRALISRVRETQSITVVERIAARELIVEDGAVAGVLANTQCGPVVLSGDRVVIAAGGIGGLYQYGTNPAGSLGQGLALAAKAGAVLADLEFVQFHPTALDAKGLDHEDFGLNQSKILNVIESKSLARDAGGKPAATFPHPALKLISETVRGEGAILVDEKGTRFMADVPGAELAPRDVVARAVWRHMQAGHRVFLDARNVPDLDFARRFPAITAICHEAGIDPVTQLIPIRPAAHYHMGGISVDLFGRSSVEGLWACGEAACTGLHGANRLASNSLLEAAVCGRLVAESVASTEALRRRKPKVDIGVIHPANPAPVREIVSRAAGVLRDREGLREAAARLYPLAASARRGSDDGTGDAAIVALMIVIAALQREESRGAHARTDFQEKAALAQRSRLTLDDTLAVARDYAPETIM